MIFRVSTTTTNTITAVLGAEVEDDITASSVSLEVTLQPQGPRAPAEISTVTHIGDYIASNIGITGHKTRVTHIPEGGLLLLPAEQGEEHEHDRSKQGQQIHAPVTKQAGSRAEHHSRSSKKQQDKDSLSGVSQKRQHETPKGLGVCE